jgi:16S rRNA (guanine527-N7)-methyltransferase
VVQSGLICLKGGDLAQEISESNTRPNIIELSHLFEEPYFTEKYLLYVKTVM